MNNDVRGLEDAKAETPAALTELRKPRLLNSKLAISIRTRLVNV